MAIVVIHGESDWSDYLAGYDVVQCRLNQTKWLVQDNQVWAFSENRRIQVEAVLWRLGAVRPEPHQQRLLALLDFAAIPCVNPTNVLLACYDRLAMLAMLKRLGLPVLPQIISLGDGMIERIQPDLPVVAKIGSYHAGYGKMRIQTAEQWAEFCDLSFVSPDYCSSEPYIEYVRDIRCLLVGDQVWAMQRRSSGWRANVATNAYQLIEPPAEILEYSQRVMQQLKADILGIDFIEDQQGTFWVLECNEIPGLAGFPEAARALLAARLLNKL
ncbi:RimK family alpha-L-glutamate ligase [Herpetosiphon sp. NSE202]|uniref:ATP-grasp domain-containing protein n=1 Tax=Herpetosiphon sp. NSE202 TaxID=3351349 RepID=UPI0036352C29